MCEHQPPCPSGTELGGLRARIVASHPEQGWYLLCNGVLLFDDGGALLADRRVVAPAPVGVPVGVR
jgi:Family of unknown function (DUF5999)